MVAGVVTHNMNRAFDWAFGLTTIALGAALMTWVLLNLFVSWHPVNEGRSVFSAIPAVILSIACLGVGFRRIWKPELAATGGDDDTADN